MSAYKNITPQVVQARKSKGTLEKRLGPEPKEIKKEYEKRKAAIDAKWRPTYESGTRYAHEDPHAEQRRRIDLHELDKWYKKNQKRTQKKHTRLISRRDDRLKRLKRIQGK